MLGAAGVLSRFCFFFVLLFLLLLRWNIGEEPAVGLVVTVWQRHCSERLSTVRLQRPAAVASRRGRSSGQTAAACRRPPPLRWPRVAEQPRGMNQRSERGWARSSQYLGRRAAAPPAQAECDGGRNGWMAP